MNGKRVERKWGWDTHGLPIENIVEKNLKISGKKEIEKIGVETFNKEARGQVLEFVNAWKNTVDRIARWVDFDGAYITMSNDYIESVWWALGEINKKGLLYEGERVLPYCPRCETPIANSEIAMDNSYKDITDISVTVKFELVDEPGTFLLAWTTTPWTLPGNVAAAVNKEITYIKVEANEEKYVLAKEIYENKKDQLFKDGSKLVGEIHADHLIGQSYKPVF
jgi:isoleucyl-tRNA synthetase